MSNNLVIHVDGSRVLSDDRNSQGLGWAVIACHDDSTHEVHGAIAEGKHSRLTGYHEHVAFVHGIRYAHQNGFDFRNLTVICDDDIFGYAQTALYPGNYRQTQAAFVMRRINWTVGECFEPEMVGVVLEALALARIHKVKGHKRAVYQERADYLARQAAWMASGATVSPTLSFAEWLEKGIDYYESSAGPRKTWRAPFLPI